ncbi:MAG: bifunctional methylenetetrahydrofolate dehydrogenase/methenyltetrahydrofolate cyclohydrolase FolD, partial [Bacilli bacterium]|nr:bifunctional methylenetetrahydrofolate dehydrogenase/methenyltetrahydrofolate cyclohydrolase FolD [Bacilli bacterium]
EVGIYSELHRLDESVSEAELLRVVQELNQNDKIHGILVQLPLPKHINPDAVNHAINPDKDVDGFTPDNIGRMHIGEPCFLPCTPHGVMKMIERSGMSPKGKHAVVIGRSNIVGKPMSQLLLAAGATVTICHSQTTDLPSFTRQADLLVAAVGRPNFVTGEMVKPGAAVYDVGINRVDGKLVGDVDFASVEPVASVITPVPGGVGPMTITMLLWNTWEAATRASAK